MIINKNRKFLDKVFAVMFSNIEYKDSYLFYAHMISKCVINIDNTLDAPAGISFNVDHYILHINANEFSKYKINEQLAILKHEMLHILYNHVQRKEDKNHKVWNYSTDCAINQLINRSDLPEKAILPSNLSKHLNLSIPKNKYSEFYYDLLIKDEDNLKSYGCCDENCSGNSDNSGDSSQDPTISHNIWDKSVGDKTLQSTITKKMIRDSASQTIKSKGTVPKELSEWISIHTVKSEISWQRELRNVVGNKKSKKRSTIMKKDRRFPNRTDLRGYTKDRTFNLIIVLDVSASMDDNSITAVLQEAKNICDMTRTNIDLIQVDTQAYEPEKLSKNTTRIRRKANGGTLLFPAVEKAIECNIAFDAIVVLTDAGIFKDDAEKFQNLNKPVLWLIEKDCYIPDFLDTKLMKSIQLKI